MNIITRLINRCVRYYLKKNKRDFFPAIIQLSNENDFIVQNIFSLQRQKLVDCAERYPSVINNGYLHIEKTIELVHFFNLNNSNAILDIGGATGAIAIKFSDEFKNAQVYSFEPIASTFKELQENTKGYPRIKPINKALGSKANRQVIHVAHRITSSSLFPIEENIGNPFFAENLQEQSLQEVEVSTLDAEILPQTVVNIIKIDVQGYELEVLKGGVETLKRTSIVVLEMQNHELYINAPRYYVLDEFMRLHGFHLYNIIPSIRQNKKLYEWDSIYVNQVIDKKYNS